MCVEIPVQESEPDLATSAFKLQVVAWHNRLRNGSDDNFRSFEQKQNRFGAPNISTLVVNHLHFMPLKV